MSGEYTNCTGRLNGPSGCGGSSPLRELQNDCTTRAASSGERLLSLAREINSFAGDVAKDTKIKLGCLIAVEPETVREKELEKSSLPPYFNELRIALNDIKYNLQEIMDTVTRVEL